MRVQAFFDFWEFAEFDGVEDAMGIFDGADVGVGEGRLLHWPSVCVGARGEEEREREDGRGTDGEGAER